MLLDEPAAGLDHAETVDLSRIIRDMADAGVAVLLVEHDMRLVMGVADRIVVVDQGRKLADGSPSEIAVDQRVIDAYLGVVPGMNAVLTVDGVSAGYGRVHQCCATCRCPSSTASSSPCSGRTALARRPC